MEIINIWIKYILLSSEATTLVRFKCPFVCPTVKNISAFCKLQTMAVIQWIVKYSEP